MFGSFDANNLIPSGRAYGDDKTANTTFAPGFTYEVRVGIVIGGDVVATLGTTTFSR